MTSPAEPDQPANPDPAQPGQPPNPDPAQPGQPPNPDPAEPDHQAASPDPAETGTSKRPGRAARLVRWLRVAYLAGLAAAAIWAVATRGPELADLLGQARPGYVAASLLAGFGLIGLSAWFWAVGLRMLEPARAQPWGEVAAATARALPGRYVPGGVTFAVARVALLRRTGAGIGPLTATAGLEMALSLAVAVAVGAALLGSAGVFPGGPIWAAAVPAVLGAGSSPALGGRLMAGLAARRGIRLNMTWSGYLRLIGVSACFWAWSASAFLLYLRAFPAADGFGAVRSAGSFMLSWAAGFLSVIAPQGIGVTEVSLAGLLQADQEGAQSLAELAVILGGYRLVLAARDLTAAAAGEVTARARRGSLGARAEAARRRRRRVTATGRNRRGSRKAHA